MKLALWQDGEWIIETPDAEGSVGKYPSIEVDQNDNVHLSYFDDTNGKLMYAGPGL